MKTKTTTLLYALSILLLATTITACEELFNVRSIEVTAETIYLSPGKSSKFKFKAIPEYASTDHATFISLNSSVATVDEEGLITGVAYGETFVSITIDGISEMCQVVVVNEGPNLITGFFTYGLKLDAVRKLDIANIEFRTPSIKILDGRYAGTGTVVKLALVYDSPQDEFQGIPDGTYPIYSYNSGKIASTTALADQTGNRFGSYVIEIVDDVETAYIPLITGEVLFKNNSAENFSIDAIASSNKSNLTLYSYGGLFYVFDYDLPEDFYYESGEPQTPTTENFHFNNSYPEKFIYQDRFNDGNLNLDFMLRSKNDNKIYAKIGVSLPPGEYSTLPEGTYNITQDGGDFTVLAGTGFPSSNMFYYYPSYVAIYGDESALWFLRSGTMEVFADSITINATSWYGSTITATYDGQIKIDASQYAPLKTAQNQPPQPTFPLPPHTLIPNPTLQ